MRGIEFQYRSEIFVRQQCLRIQPASRQRHIGDADLRRIPESHSDGVFIILGEKGIVNVAGDLLTMLIPVVQRLLLCNAHHLRMKPNKAANIVGFRQHVHNGVLTVLIKHPRLRRKRITPCARVRYVEHIPHLRHVAGAFNQGDSLCTAPHIPAHPLIPQLVGRASRRVRALGEDHELILIAVLVQSRGCVKKRAPSLKPGGDLPCGLNGQFLVSFEFFRHFTAPFPCLPWIFLPLRDQEQVSPSAPF